MLEKISVYGYKAINNETLNIKPLSLIVGPNSTGKSSLMQAIFIASIIKENDQQEILNDYLQFDNASNRIIDADKICFSICDKEIKNEIKITKDEILVKNNTPYKNYEQDLFYLSANRIGVNNLEKLPPKNIKIGFDGKYAVGSLEINKETYL